MGRSLDGGREQEAGLFSLEAGAYEEDPGLAASLVRAFADTTTDAVIVKDLAGRVLLVNPAAVEMFGVGEEGLLGRQSIDFYGDLSEASVAELHDRLVIDDGVSAQLEEELLLRGGQRRTLLTHKTPWRDGSGEVIGLVCISRDVTERKELERLLLAKRVKLEQVTAEVTAAEARYRTFFENLTEGVLVYEAQRNPLGEITGWVYRDGNTAAEQAYGKPLREILGKTVSSCSARSGPPSSPRAGPRCCARASSCARSTWTTAATTRRAASAWTTTAWAWSRSTPPSCTSCRRA